MDENARGLRLTSSAARWWTSAFIILLFAAINLPWQLDDYDQAKQAYTSWEMVRQGHWLYQHAPNEAVATKPPLVGWISAGLFEATRWWDGAWRLPSLLSAVAMLVLIARETTAASGPTAGLIALSAFGLNLLSPRLATLVRTDMPLALAIFLTGLQIWRKIRDGANWNFRDRLVAFFCLTIALMIKGPIIYAFLLPGLVFYQIVRRKKVAGPSNGEGAPGQPFEVTPRDSSTSLRSAQNDEGAPSAWAGWWPWILSLAIFLAWVIGGIVSQAGFYETVVVKEFAGRFTETFHKPQPIYFYLPHLLQKFAPWSVLMIALAIVARRGRRLRRSLRSVPPATLWLIAWSLGGLLLMSIIPSKRVDRIFPVIPPFCLLLGTQIAACERRDWLRPKLNRWLAAALIFAAIFSGSYALGKIVSGYHGKRDSLVRFAREVRRRASAEGARYGVVRGREEGMLLYLRCDRFLSPEMAAAKWRAGELDAVVVPNEPSRNWLELFPGAKLSMVSEKSSSVPQYSLFDRAKPP